MDPSYNNPFDSLTNSGGGTGVSSGATSGASAAPGAGAASGAGATSGATPGAGNPFGQPVSSGAPVSSGTGDIILAGASDKKRKWPVALLLVALILIVIGLVVAYFVMKPGGNGGTNPSNYSAEFNKFANYVVKGQDSNARLDYTSDDYSDTYFVKQFSDANVSVSDKTSILGKTSSLYDEFLAKYSGTVENNEESELSLGSYLNQLVVETDEIIDFMQIAFLKDEITTDSITDYYLANGREATLTEFSNYYVFPENSNSYINSFKESIKNTLDIQLAILDIYSQNECLTAELSPYQCMKQKSDEATLNDLTEKTLDLERELMILDSYYVEPGELVERVLMINSLMYDGESSEYWNETE